MIQRSACIVAGGIIMQGAPAMARMASAMARYSTAVGASFGVPSAFVRPAARHIQTSTTTALPSPAMARAKALVFGPRSPLKPSTKQRSAASTWERSPFGVMPCAYCRALALLWAHVTRGEKADTTEAATTMLHSGRIDCSDSANCRASEYHA